MIILVISDSIFFPHLKSAIASVQSNCPASVLHCHLINPEDSQLQLIKEKNITITKEYKTFKNNEERRGYCVNVRSILVKNLLEQGHDSVLYLDADSIIRRDCRELQQLIKKNDLVILHNTEKEEELRHLFNCGIIGFNNSTSTKKFVDKWITKIEEIGFYKWYSDQIGFAYIYEEMKAELFLLSMPLTFHDSEFLSDSHIWTGRGPRKYKNKIFKLEEKYYQKLFDNQVSSSQKYIILAKQHFWRTTSLSIYYLKYFVKKIIRR